MRKLIFVDDMRDPFKPPHSEMITALLTNDITEEVSLAEVIWVTNYTEFIDEITRNGLPDILSLDHDLCFDAMVGLPSTEKTGYDCAKWLVDYCLDNGKKLPEITQCHSQNPAGKKNILSLLSNFRKAIWK